MPRPPDPHALRRDRDHLEWIDLPSGREGDPPEWPLSKATAREIEIWKAEWSRPQAVIWEANNQALEVALYVRSLREAEKPGAPVTLSLLVRKHMYALGLTIPGMKANRWRIGVEQAPAEERIRPAASLAKKRLKLLDPPTVER